MNLRDVISLFDDFPKDYLEYLCTISNVDGDNGKQCIRVGFNYTVDKDYFYFEMSLFDDGSVETNFLDSNREWSEVPADVILIAYEVIKRWTDYKEA